MIMEATTRDFIAAFTGPCDEEAFACTICKAPGVRRRGYISATCMQVHSRDADGRPSDRYGFPETDRWLERCEGCGYVAEDIAAEDRNLFPSPVRKILALPGYRRMLEDVTLPREARLSACRAMIEEWKNRLAPRVSGQPECVTSEVLDVPERLEDEPLRYDRLMQSHCWWLRAAWECEKITQGDRAKLEQDYARAMGSWPRDWSWRPIDGEDLQTGLERLARTALMFRREASRRAAMADIQAILRIADRRRRIGDFEAAKVLCGALDCLAPEERQPGWREVVDEIAGSARSKDLGRAVRRPEGFWLED
jgi:hypothetical protein